jgi:preprotein translocase subunit SecY
MVLLGLLNMFSGGAFSNASIFALGIMPYISASIVIQLMSVAVPYFSACKKKVKADVRKLTRSPVILPFSLLLHRLLHTWPTWYRSYLPKLFLPLILLASPSFFFMISSVVILIAGTMFVMWLGERITEKGIGNGISLIIMIGIIAQLPFALFAAEFISPQ